MAARLHSAAVLFRAAVVIPLVNYAVLQRNVMGVPAVRHDMIPGLLHRRDRPGDSGDDVTRGQS